MDIVRNLMVAKTEEDARSVAESEVEETSEVVSKPLEKPKKRKKKSNVNNNEVNLLRKEIEEMKFYQELEQTEYQEMKEKMHSYEKQMKKMEKRKTKEDSKPDTVNTTTSIKTPKSNKTLRKIEEEIELDSNMDTVDLIAIKSPPKKKVPKISEVDRLIQKKIKKRDTQIQQLKTKLHEKDTSSKESSDKLRSLAVEYERRLNRMESLKNEEIEEVKDHCKQMIETLAKQVQKTTKRYNEALDKSTKAQSIMGEMRTDMASREKELEKKIKAQQVTIKKNEMRLIKAETKVDRSGSKYTSIRNEMDEALKMNQEYAEKMKTMQHKYQRDINSLEEKYEERINSLKKKHEEEEAGLQIGIEEEVSELSAKLLDMEKLFDEEAAEHDKTCSKLQDLAEQLKEKEEEAMLMKDNMKNIDERSEHAYEELKDQSKREYEELREHSKCEYEELREQSKRECDEVRDQSKREYEELKVQSKRECDGLKKEIKVLNQKVIEKNDANVKRVTDLAKGSMSATNELMEMREKCSKYEITLKLLNSDKTKKKENMKNKLIEIERLQSRLERINDVHLRELKTKDIDFVKARKKWTMGEDKLKSQIQELKESQKNYQQLEETDSGKIMIQTATEDQKLIQSQKELIDQLKADKASLQMSVASYNGKENKELILLKKELENTKRALAQTAYERRLEETLAKKEPDPHREELMTRSESFAEDLPHEDSNVSHDKVSYLEASRIDEANGIGMKEKTFKADGREKSRARSRSRSRAVSRERSARTTFDESSEEREKVASDESRGRGVGRPRAESRGRRMSRPRAEGTVRGMSRSRDESRGRAETDTSVPVDIGTIDSTSLEVSTDSSTVPVNEPKKGITAQRSYRNYVRNRKFSKRRTSIQNE